MKTPVFTGLATAIITPFHDGKVNYKKFGELIDLQIAGGASAIVVCGTTGESSTQSLDEHIATVDYCVKYVNSRAKVVAGAGSNDTHDALYLAQEAEKAGADALLMVTPYYNKTTQRGLIKHYSFVADRVNIPIIMYNVPSRTGLSFTADTYKELSKHPNINGVKEASGSISLVSATISACGDDFFVWSGNDTDTVPFMALGAKGVICTSSNIIPVDMADMTKLCLEGDFKSAAAIQLKYYDLIDKLFIEVNPMPLKAAMNILGMDVGEPRMPLCDLAPENFEKLKKSLAGAGLLKDI